MTNDPSVFVLVTGSAGRIGQAAVRGLKARGHRVRGLDLVSSRGVDADFVGTITDADHVRRAMEGVEALVHLAGIPDDDDFLTRLLPNNVIGVYQVFEAARQAGVKRLILGSSGQVVWWQRFTGSLPIRADDWPTPKAWYAVCKMFMEGAGLVFAESAGMSVVAVRLGWCPRNQEHAEELARTEWGPNVYLSPQDAGRFFACAVEAPAYFRHAVVYACSRPLRREVYDSRPSRDLLGYLPQDTWPQGAEELLEESVLRAAREELASLHRPGIP
jgi:nucleoside-diphosphate-sugar epimerase